MKVTLFAKKKLWYTKKIIEAAKKNDVDLDVLDIKNFKDLYGRVEKKIGDVVFCRTTKLSTEVTRACLFNVVKDKLVINRGVFEKPYVFYKYYQQFCIKDIGGVNHIPTFLFDNKEAVLSAMEDNKIKLPFIAKPDKGARGEGIFLIKKIKDLDEIKEFPKYIFQNYIKNEGDYRVLMLGGKVLGIIKRVAKEGAFLNNVSKGATAFVEKDPAIIKELTQIAAKSASYFELSFCGIDIMYDEDKKKYFFLEINTCPQWEGFQEATGIDVADRIINFIKDFYYLKNKNNNDISSGISRYYEEDLNDLLDKKHHFLSRMYLWTKKEKYLNELIKMEDTFLGKGKDDISFKIKTILDHKDDYNRMVINNKIEREPFVKKYYNLGVFHKVLYINLMAHSIYKKNISNIISGLIKNEEIIDLKNQLLKNKKALLSLSTFAVNFLYLAKKYLEEGSEKFSLEPEFFLRIVKEESINNESVAPNLHLLYMLTHVIINESEFYSKKITENKKALLTLLREAEAMITKNYHKLSLDSKVEFLVCTRLLNYKTSIIEDIILSECSVSVSDVGCYLADNNNNVHKGVATNNYFSSEHRNVLFLISQINIA